MAITLGLNGCASSQPTEGYPVPQTSITPEAALNHDLEQRLNKAGQRIAAVIGCITADKTAGATNLEDNHLSNTAHVIGPDFRLNTSDDGLQRVMVSISRSKTQGNIRTFWAADWQAPPADGSPGESLSLYVSGVVPRGSTVGSNTQLPGGSLVLGPNQVRGGAPDLEADTLIFENNHTGTTIERRPDGVYYRPEAASLELLTPELMTQFDARVTLIADRMLRISQVNPPKCELE